MPPKKEKDICEMRGDNSVEGAHAGETSSPARFGGDADRTSDAVANRKMRGARAKRRMMKTPVMPVVWLRNRFSSLMPAGTCP